MAARTPSPNPATLQSYTAMARDVEDIGAHCTYCRKLDFLPFTCRSCKQNFCLDHRTETAHECSKPGEWARSQRPAPSNSMLQPTKRMHDERICALPGCKEAPVSVSLTTGVVCESCRRVWCLKHRMPEVHDCKKLVPLGIAQPNALQQQRDRGMRIIAKLREKTQKMAEESKKKKSSGGITSLFGTSSTKSAAAKALLELNALKKQAKGDPKVPSEKRIYLHVEASADTTRAKYPTGKFYYNVDWTVGRILDLAAKALAVENVNNRGGGEEDRLRVFHVESGRLMKFNEKIGDGARTGNTIVLLRGVGEPDLIDL